MTYRELKRLIKNEAKNYEGGYTSYITYMSDNNNQERLSSNFIDDCSGITDDQLIKAEKEGLLVRDFDTYEVIGAREVRANGKEKTKINKIEALIKDLGYQDYTEMWADFMNNFLTIKGFADYHMIDKRTAIHLLDNQETDNK